MLKKLLSLIFVLFLFLIQPKPLSAANEFNIDALVEYKVLESGKTVVTHDITLENVYSTIYATTYSLSLENIDAQNISVTNENGKHIQVDTVKEGEKTTIKLTFSDQVVGRGEKRHFFVSYENTSFAARTGEVWEVSIPRLAPDNTFKNYSVDLVVPQTFGLEAYVSPKPSDVIQDSHTKKYRFSKDDLIKTGITAGFGQFQVFAFTLAYHLENPLAVSAETQIALPPDTSFQKMYYSKISPEPNDVVIDADGNWLATYKLNPRQRVDVNVSGSVQIFASYRKFPKPSDTTLSDNLKQSDYWQVDDPQIKALAAELKTPEAIYNYVSNTLKYDFGRVTPNVQRFGAKKALENPQMAICMEFTDLFIALARAAGIPAREVNGYAYTENPELQPLSLVADVLHSWPEYYDADKGTWIPIDPTWGSTTGGEDFFNKLDLRHFAFVIHGESPIKPYAPGSYKLGPNPQKDVFVSFGKLPEARISIPRLSVVAHKTLPFMDSVYTVTVSNPGPAALYSVYPTIYFDNAEKSRDFIEVLTPYSNRKVEVKVPFSILGKDTPNEVRVAVDTSEIKIATNKSQVILNSLLSILLVCAAIVIAVLVKLRKITFDPLISFVQGIFDKIQARHDKNSGKSSQNPPAGA